MTQRQHFLVNGQHLGTAERRLELVHADYCAPLSLLFYCPTCGEVWARCPVEGHDQWLAYRMPCEKHPHPAYERPGGSLLVEWLPELVDTFPEGVLRRELNLWLNYVQGTTSEKF